MARYYKSIFVDANQMPDGNWIIDGQFVMNDEDFKKAFVPVKDTDFEIPQLEAGRFLMPIKYKEEK